MYVCMYVFNVLTILCVTFSNLYNNNLFIRYSYNTTIRYSSFTSARNSSGDLQTTTVFFTCNFIQSWLNSYYSSSSLPCPFIVQRNQSNERSWSRMFVFSPSREPYCDFIFVCVLYAHCCLCTVLPVYCVHIVICAFAYLSIPFSLMLVVVLGLLIIS